VITAMPRIAIAMRDYDAALTTFRERFGLPVVDFSDRTVPDLGTHVGMCMPEGGSNIELMAPSDPDAPLSQSLLKFLDRRGDGLYALMLEAPDPDAEAAALAERDLEVLPLMKGAGGRDLHPRSTHGVLIRVYPDGSVVRPDGLSTGEPGLSGIVRAIVATTDAAKAAEVYGRGLGLDVGPAEEDTDRGVTRALVSPPKGGVIELVSVIDATRPFGQAIERFLGAGGRGLYGLVLTAADPEAAVTVLEARGLAVDRDAGNEIDVFGARFFIQ
jgi:catechol 2,3-dioxygenase-like lactoylglutathione lyase family enzyme